MSGSRLGMRVEEAWFCALMMDFVIVEVKYIVGKGRAEKCFYCENLRSSLPTASPHLA